MKPPIKNWKLVREQLKWNFRHLTDQDLRLKRGEEEQLVKRLSEKLGNNKKEVLQILQKLDA